MKRPNNDDELAMAVLELVVRLRQYAQGVSAWPMEEPAPPPAAVRHISRRPHRGACRRSAA